MNKELLEFLKPFRDQNKKIVLATGVFDLLHEEHKNFLLKAKKIGDVLAVGIESDKRVKQLKGDERPINSEQLRKQNLEKWGIADKVFILPEQFSSAADHDALIAVVKP